VSVLPVSEVTRKVMKLFILLFIVSINISAQDWELVWSDEFDSTSLDLDSWTYEIGGNGWGNNELQYYTDREENLYLQDGKLIIKAIEENYGGRPYTSARIKTQNKRFYQYGKIEAGIKQPYGQGIWTAFWMMGQNISSAGWPACGEIDIMEMIGGQDRENTVYGTAHWDNNSDHAQYGDSYTLSSGTFSDDFHVFSIEWNQNSIKWYVDNILYNTIDLTPSGLSEFHQEFFIILNLAVGGTWPGYPDTTTVFPQYLEVDYVRVYQDEGGYPYVNIISPEDNSVFDLYPDIQVEVEAGDPNSTIQRIELYQGEALIGIDLQSPYIFNWVNIYEGCYKLKARSRNSTGLVTASSVINVTVGNGCTHSPYTGKPVQLPGSVEAENYDLGGNNTAYYDLDPAVNQGASYRPDEGVDIEPCTDINGGYNVGWIETGEWINYFINVTQEGFYDIIFRVASDGGGGIIKLESDDVEKTGNIIIASTGGWQNWTDVTADNIFLEGGVHILKVRAVNGNFNLNRITFHLTAVDVEDKPAPSVVFNLEQNYPNPFNPETAISFSLPEEAHVNLEVYDSKGSEIESLLNEQMLQGRYTVYFNAESLSSQVLFYKISVSTINRNFNAVRKMIFLK